MSNERTPTSNLYSHPMPPLDVALNRAGQCRHFGARADAEQKKLVVLADEIERLRAALVDSEANYTRWHQAFMALKYGPHAPGDAEALTAVETREQPLVLNGHQLRQALEFLDNENDTDLCFWLYIEDRLEPGKHGEPMPKGMYCWFFEYPEEGQLLLSDRPTAQKASALPKETT